jgi:hypothetical protein
MSDVPNILIACFAGLWLAAILVGKIAARRGGSLLGNSNGNGNGSNGGNDKVLTQLGHMVELEREAVELLREMSTQSKVECERRQTMREQLGRIENKLNELTKEG